MTVGYRSAFISDYNTVCNNGKINSDNSYCKALKNMFELYNIPSDVLLKTDNEGNIYVYDTNELLTSENNLTKIEEA